MKVEFVGRDYYIDEKLKTLLLKKLKKLDRLFGDEVKAKLTLSQDSTDYYMEITIAAAKPIRAEVKSQNMYDNIDLLIPKVTRQFRKAHTEENPQKREAAVEKAEFNKSLEEAAGAE